MADRKGRCSVPHGVFYEDAGEVLPADLRFRVLSVFRSLSARMERAVRAHDGFRRCFFSSHAYGSSNVEANGVSRFQRRRGCYGRLWRIRFPHFPMPVAGREASERHPGVCAAESGAVRPVGRICVDLRTDCDMQTNGVGTEGSDSERASFSPGP